jgi:GMP synthase (glutamine-hydrolysing)
VLTNFLEHVCGCERSWSPRSVIEEQIDAIRNQVAGGHAICGLSGGRADRGGAGLRGCDR